VAEPARVLVELGLHNATLDTVEVSRLLQEEVAQASEVLTFPTVQAGLLTMQTEARVMRGSLDCLGEERDKLRQDLLDANQRSELLAQEIDEQHARQEKESREEVQALETRWAEQVREVTRQAEEEQEATHDKVFELQRLLSQNSSNFKSIESHLKKDIENLLKENDRLEVENKTLQQQSREAEELLRNMKREQENIGLLRKHLMVVENGAKTGQNGRSPDLAKQVEELAAMNKDLKDKNDELILHLKPSDGCRTTICMERQIGKAPLIPGSTLYSEDFLSYDDKENTPKPDDNIQRISIKDVHEQDSSGQGPGKLVSKIPISGETQDSERSMKKNHQIVSNIFNPFMNTFNGSMLPIDDLDQVKYKIVEILSQKDNYSRENQSLKSHQTAYSELLRQNEELRQKVSRLECESVGEVPDLICGGDKRSPRVEVGVDRSSPDGQEGGAEEPAGQSPCQDQKGGQEAQSEVKELQLLRQKMLELEQERRRLLEKNKQLEESLELMSNEFRPARRPPTMSRPVIWLIGGPGSGKGTQCDNIVVRFGYTHLSSGELLRMEVLSGSDRGKQLWTMMQQGLQVPDEEVINLIAEAMSAAGDSKGFVLDGFPASLEQAKLFEAKISSPSKILFFDVNDVVLKERLFKRQNFDDNPAAIDKRLETFSSLTKPVVAAYKSAIQIDAGERQPADIFADVVKALEC